MRRKREIEREKDLSYLDCLKPIREGASLEGVGDQSSNRFLNRKKNVARCLEFSGAALNSSRYFAKRAK